MACATSMSRQKWSNYSNFHVFMYVTICIQGAKHGKLVTYFFNVFVFDCGCGWISCGVYFKIHTKSLKDLTELLLLSVTVNTTFSMSRLYFKWMSSNRSPIVLNHWVPKERLHANIFSNCLFLTNDKLLPENSFVYKTKYLRLCAYY